MVFNKIYCDNILDKFEIITEDDCKSDHIPKQPQSISEDIVDSENIPEQLKMNSKKDYGNSHGQLETITTENSDSVHIEKPLIVIEEDSYDRDYISQTEGIIEEDDDDSDYIPESDYENSDEESEKDEQNNTPHLEEVLEEADLSNTSTVYSEITPKVLIQERLTPNGNWQQKFFACLFCEQLVTKLPRHLERKHPFEDKVKNALQFPKRSKERRLAWLAIQQEGNYHHNYNVLDKGCGLLIPKYRSRKNQKKAVADYVPCEFCFGLYIKTDLWKHHKDCKVINHRRNTVPMRGKPISNGKMLLPNVEVSEEVLVKMREDEVKDIIKKDQMILEFANRLYEQNGHLQHRHQFIAQRLRELGRMLMAMKEKNKSIDTLKKCLDPVHWEDLITAVKFVAGFNSEMGQYSIPTLPLRIGQSLVKCAKLLKTRSIILCNEDMRKKMDEFLELYDEEWSTRIAVKCHNTLDLAKINKPQLLPLTKDVQMLHRFLKQESEKLRKICKEDDFRRFAEICLAQLILFNRKRSGEAERIKIQDFYSSVIEPKVDQDVFDSLTLLEKEILKSHKRIEIVGKRGKKVPVILTDDMIQNMNCLLKIREKMNITSNFLFGKPNSQFPIRGSDALRNLALESGVSNPNLLTSTMLRKHLATLSQVLGLNEHGQDALAKFMGHDIRVHRSYYELPENTTQLARMSKVLHDINEGKASKVSAEQLEEIDVTQEEILADNSDSDVDEHDEDEYGNKKGKCSGDQKELIQKKKRTNRYQGSRMWSHDEEQAVLRHLGHFIDQRKIPGKHKCQEVKQKEKALSTRSWEQVKHFIRNRITRKNKKSFTSLQNKVSS